MLIIVYLIDIASDITSNKEHPPYSPLKRRIGYVVINKRTYQPCPLSPFES